MMSVFYLVLERYVAMFSFAVQSPENENYCVCVTSEPTQVRLEGLRAVDVCRLEIHLISGHWLADWLFA